MTKPASRSKVVRSGISLEPELLATLDRWVARRNSGSRSEAIRALIRRELARESLTRDDADALATVTLLFRHDDPGVLGRLTAAEHRWGEHIRSSTHVHLQGKACIEVLLLLGRNQELAAAATDLCGVRGLAWSDFTVGCPRLAGGSTGHEHPHRVADGGPQVPAPAGA